MSLLFMDGFGHISLASSLTGGTASFQKWNSVFFAGQMYPTQDEGRFTPGALRLKASGGGGWIERSLGDHTELIVGFSYKPTSIYFTTVEFGTDLAEPLAGPRITMLPDGVTGDLSVATPGGAVAEALGVLSDDTWVFIEFRIKLGTSDGEIEIKVDGVQVALTTGADTASTATVMDTIRVEVDNNAQQDWMDDLYVLSTTGSDNNTFVHDGVKTPRISVLKPKADGDINTFGPVNDGSDTQAWQAVNDALANQNTDYVGSSIVGASEEYVMETFADLSLTSGTIHGIQVANNVNNSGVAPLSFIDEIVIAGARYTSGAVVVPYAPQFRCSLYIRGTDPSDGTAWTEAKVEAVGSAFSIVDPA